MAKEPNIEREKLTETEFLKLENAMLKANRLELLYAQAITHKNTVFQEILKEHGFQENAGIKYPEGIIEGEKIKLEAVKDDKESNT